MKTTLFFGHEIADKIHARTRKLIAQLGRAPRCAVLLDRGSAPMMAYAGRQKQAAEALGIELVWKNTRRKTPMFFSSSNGFAAMTRWMAAMTLYPLPGGVDPLAAAEALGSAKDVDGLHPLNAGLLALGRRAGAPATARACALAVAHLLPSVKGAEVAIVGASMIVGRPLAALLLDAEATVTVCHAATRDLYAHTRRADLGGHRRVACPG